MPTRLERLRRENGAPLRVLVAEDHEIGRALLEMILDLVNAELVVTENGADAVAAFREGEFDVVLMDLQMPVLDGLAATRQIRAHESRVGRARTPVLAVTANTLSTDRLAALAAGADRHVPKPVMPDGLLDTIAETIEALRGTRH